jgi:hypothetical protein
VRSTRALDAPQGVAGLPGRRLENPPHHAQHNPGKGGDQLTVTLSITLALSGVVILLCRYAGLRVWHAAVCIVLGFALASSSLAPDISSVTQSLIRLL